MQITRYEEAVDKNGNKVGYQTILGKFPNSYQPIAEAKYRITTLINNIKIFQLICVVIEVNDCGDEIKKEFITELLKLAKQLVPILNLSLVKNWKEI